MYIKTKRYSQFDSNEIKESFFKEFLLPKHFHDVYCIGLVNKGMKETIVEDNSYIIHSNSLTIVNPYQIHSDQSIGKDGSLFKMLYINEEVVKFFAKKITGESSTNILFTNELILEPRIVTALLNLFQDEEKVSLLEGKLYHLMELLLINYKLHRAPESIHESNNAIKENVEKARLNFADKIDIGKMAADSKLSKYQFIRQFKKYTGITPASYIIICRINFAKSLLEHGYPIGHAALEAGFYDHAQFCKYFKYFTNLTPINYKSNCNIIQA